MIQCKKTPLEEVAEYLGELKQPILRFSARLCSQVQEIRLRAGRPIVLHIKNKSIAVDGANVTRGELEQCFERICQFSVHSFGREISQGFITLKGGHRAGLCGTAVVKNGRVESMKDISGINFRIAREISGCADEIMDKCFCGELRSLIIAGAPSSGKTTMLRDLAKQLGARHKVCIIDERSEIAAVYRGEPQLDVGLNTDVLDGFPKGDGIMAALRALSPEIILCDEIGGDYDEVSACLNAGVRVVVTAHADSFGQLCRRQATAGLIKTGAFEMAVMLCGGENIGEIDDIYAIT